MKITEFLNGISTPKIESNSYSVLLLNKPNKFSYKDSKVNQTEIQYSHETFLKSSTNYQNKNTSLNTVSPFYTKNKQQPIRFFNLSCHIKNHPKDLNKENFGFMKKGQKSQSTWQIRKHIGKQKRYFLRNYERFTYQPPRPKQSSIQSSAKIRIQTANAKIIHKFCRLFDLQCAGCKCKLDCINHQFELFLKQSNLCILKGLNQIVGRGMNLDKQIKSQIMNQFLCFNKNKEKNKEDFMEKINQLIKKKLNKNSKKKYLSWAKSMYEIIKKIQNYSEKKESNKKKLANKQLILKEQLQNYSNYNSKQYQTNKKKMNKFLKNQRFYRTINFTSTLQKNRKNKKKDDKKQLSIIGSHKQVTFKQNSLNSSVQSKNLKGERSNSSLFQNKFKSKLKKYNSISQSNSRKRLRVLTPGSTKLLQLIHQKSGFYNNISENCENIFDSKSEKWLNQNNKKEENTSQQSIIQQNEERQTQKRLQMFQNMLNNFQKLQNKIKPLNVLKNIEKQPLQKNIHINNINQQQKIQNNATSLSKKKFQKIRTSHINDHKTKSHFLQKISIIKTDQIPINKQIEKITQRKAQQSQKLIKSKNKLKKKQKTIAKISKSIEGQGIFNRDTSKRYQMKFHQKQINPNLQQIYQKIKNNTHLIQRIQKQLTQFGYQSSIINKTDTLFTQKRKVTFMRDKIAKGGLRSVAEDFQQYFRLIMNLKQFTNIQSILKSVLQNKKIQQKQTQRPIQEKELQQLLREYRSLKFYNLKHKGILDLQQSEKQKQNIISFQPQIKEKIQYQSAANRQFLGKIQSYVTQKQKTPFDYFHYLQLGQNIAHRKFFNQRNYSDPQLQCSKLSLLYQNADQNHQL